jgi:hypothetical protein
MASLPPLPAEHHEFSTYIAKHPKTAVAQLLEPYKAYDTKVRELFAQDPSNKALEDPYVNVVPVFGNDTPTISIRARELETESQDEKDKYIIPLKDADRKPNGSPAGE